MPLMPCCCTLCCPTGVTEFPAFYRVSVNYLDYQCLSDTFYNSTQWNYVDGEAINQGGFSTYGPTWQCSGITDGISPYSCFLTAETDYGTSYDWEKFYFVPILPDVIQHDAPQRNWYSQKRYSLYYHNNGSGCVDPSCSGDELLDGDCSPFIGRFGYNPASNQYLYQDISPFPFPPGNVFLPQAPTIGIELGRWCIWYAETTMWEIGKFYCSGNFADANGGDTRFYMGFSQLAVGLDIHNNKYLALNGPLLPNSGIPFIVRESGICTGFGYQGEPDKWPTGLMIGHPTLQFSIEAISGIKQNYYGCGETTDDFYGYSGAFFSEGSFNLNRRVPTGTFLYVRERFDYDECCTSTFQSRMQFTTHCEEVPDGLGNKIISDCYRGIEQCQILEEGSQRRFLKEYVYEIPPSSCFSYSTVYTNKLGNMNVSIFAQSYKTAGEIDFVDTSGWILDTDCLDLPGPFDQNGHPVYRCCACSPSGWITMANYKDDDLRVNCYCKKFTQLWEGNPNSPLASGMSLCDPLIYPKQLRLNVSVQTCIPCELGGSRLCNCYRQIEGTHIINRLSCSGYLPWPSEPNPWWNGWPYEDTIFEINPCPCTPINAKASGIIGIGKILFTWGGLGCCGTNGGLMQKVSGTSTCNKLGGMYIMQDGNAIMTMTVEAV